MGRPKQQGFRGTFAVRWEPNNGLPPLRNLQRLTYVSADGREFVIPSGFRSDLASIPRAARSFAPSKVKSGHAALLHDWLYATHLVSRREADALFFEALRCEGVGWLDRWQMWVAVRVFGGFRWRRVSAVDELSNRRLLDTAPAETSEDEPADGGSV